MDIASDKLLTNNTTGYKAVFMDYKHFFNTRNIPFEIKASRIICGTFQAVPEWLLYISIIKPQISEVLELLFPLLTKGEISLAMPENSQIHGMILDGSLGIAQVAKVIIIRVHNYSQLANVAEMLIKHTEDFKGPEITAAIKLGGNIYTEIDIVPFSTTDNIDPIRIDEHPWPFGSIVKPKRYKRSKWIAKKYLITQILKNDPKGNVLKALNLKNWFNIKFCVIKEGKANQCVDDYGRSIIQRLEWQAFIHQHFFEDGFLPKVLDLFTWNKDAYLVMEYIDGIPYNAKISEIQEGTLYPHLTREKKEALLKLMLQLVNLIERFHQKGYLHRDVSPMNFMVKNTGELVAIDVELAYNLREGIPNPWFTLGTEGYMSPNQAALQIPDSSDDIYGLGGMLIRTLTGVSPIKFDQYTATDLTSSNLNYFIKDQRLLCMLIQCRDINPSLRPALASIRHTLELTCAKLLVGSNNVDQIKPYTPHQKELILTAIRSYDCDPLIGPNQLWYTKARDADGQSKTFSFYPDLFLGAAGTLHLLSSLEILGCDVDSIKETIDINIQKVLEDSAKVNDDNAQLPGLFEGHSGIALALAKLIDDGQLERSIINANLIVSLISTKRIGNFSIDSGLAGTGLGIMKTSYHLRLSVLEEDLMSIADEIIKIQLKDGGWYANDYLKSKNEIVSGLFHGVAGIAYFLLVFGHRYDHAPSLESAGKALDYLVTQMRNEGKIIHIPPSTGTLSPDPWLENGFSGVAYVFIRAFEYNPVEKYKQIACTLLANHPHNITSNYISQANGITGVGEVYLEAWRVFNEDIWLKKAENIGSFLSYSYSHTAKGSIYWLDGNDSLPVPGFMNGNAGVLHFLARLNSPLTVDFPFIHFKL